MGARAAFLATLGNSGGGSVRVRGVGRQRKLSDDEAVDGEIS